MTCRLESCEQLDQAVYESMSSCPLSLSTQEVMRFDAYIHAFNKSEPTSLTRTKTETQLHQTTRFSPGREVNHAEGSFERGTQDLRLLSPSPRFSG